MDLLGLICAMSIPSAFTGFCFWMLERRINKKQETSEAQEKKRERYQLYLIKSVDASIALGEATARAVERIPDAHCNGDMHAALEYATKVKHQKKDFLEEQAIEALQN